MADVRRRADRLDPVGGGLAGHRDAVVEVARAVVEARQDVAVEVDHLAPRFAGPSPFPAGRKCKRSFSDRPEQARDYDDRQDHGPVPLGLRSSWASTHWIRRRPAEGTTSLAPTTCSSTESSASPSTRTTSGSGSSRPRSSSASSTRASARRSWTTSSTSPSAARSPSPAPRLGEHINENWEDLVGPANRSLVHWIRRLVFRGAWLDQRVKEGELDVVFDERTQTFGYVQPDRSSELIELSKEPSWRRIAYRR